MNLSRQAGPIYLQIAAILKRELHNYQAGDYLPGELPLAERFQVNRHTVRSALEVLENEGYVIRVQGKGTQLLEAPLRYPVVEQSAYSDWFQATGHEVKARLIGRVRRCAHPDEIRYLKLAATDEVLECRTLRLISQQPVSLIRHCFSIKHETWLQGYKKGSMREHLRQHGQELRREFSLIGARLPSSEEASRLLMPKHRPVLTVQTLSKNQDGLPVELAFSLSRADRFQYHVLV